MLGWIGYYKEVPKDLDLNLYRQTFHRPYLWDIDRLQYHAQILQNIFDAMTSFNVTSWYHMWRIKTLDKYCLLCYCRHFSNSTYADAFFVSSLFLNSDFSKIGLVNRISFFTNPKRETNFQICIFYFLRNPIKVGCHIRFPMRQTCINEGLV